MITYRLTKGFALSWAELDENFRTLADLIPVSLENYGAQDSQDIAPAFVSAMAAFPQGCKLIVPPTSSYYLLNSLITTPDGVPYVIEGSGYSSKIQKNYNGDMVSLGKLGSINNIYLYGNGANFTGRGVVVSTGAVDSPEGYDSASWRHISNTYILGTSSFGIDFTAASAGYASVVDRCRILPYGNIAIPSINFASTAGNCNVTLEKVWTGSNPIAAFGGAINMQVVDCQGAFPVFTSTSIKIDISGSRLVTPNSGTGTFDGNSNTVTGCTVNTTGLVFSSTLINCKWKGNAVGSGTAITDNSPGFSQGNEIDLTVSSFTPSWSATISNPDISDGEIGGSFSRNGEYCKGDIRVIMGPGTSFGSGEWAFSTPYTIGRSRPGSWVALDTGTARYTGGVDCIGAGNIMRLVVNAGGAYLGSSAPFTWANGDQLYISFDYLIA